ncbi:hypothetical protein GC169_08000 [bacterium]|nr:hypothetical protein [bacterium]
MIWLSGQIILHMIRRFTLNAPARRAAVLLAAMAGGASLAADAGHADNAPRSVAARQLAANVGAKALSAPAPARAAPTEPSAVAGLLAAHNEVRAKAKAPALDWSADLEREADGIVSKLVTGDCGQAFRPLREARKVANVYAGSAVVESGGARWAQTLTPKFVVGEWAAVRFSYDLKSGACTGSSGACESYARIIAPEARRVGCSMQMCPTKGQVWVCRYE